MFRPRVSYLNTEIGYVPCVYQLQLRILGEDRLFASWLCSMDYILRGDHKGAAIMFSGLLH